MSSISGIVHQEDTPYSMTLVIAHERRWFEHGGQGTHIAVDLRAPAAAPGALSDFLTQSPLSTCITQLSRGYGRYLSRLWFGCVHYTW